MTDYDSEAFMDLPDEVRDAIEEFGDSGFSVSAKKKNLPDGYEITVQGVKSEGAPSNALTEGTKKFVVKFTSKTVTSLPSGDVPDLHTPKSMPAPFKKAIDKLLNYGDYFWVRALDNADLGIAEAELGFSMGITEGASLIDLNSLSIIAVSK